MQYIFKEVSLNIRKNLLISLKAIKGVNFSRSKMLITKLAFNLNSRTFHLNPYFFSNLNFILRVIYNTEVALTRIRENNLRVIKNLDNHRSNMHKLGLPSRGQRTRSNGNTKFRQRSNFL